MKKVLSMLLTACMLLTLPPVTVLAEGVTSTELSGEITGFDELSTTTMAVPLGTELKDLELPKSLMATVRAAAEVEFDMTEEPVQDANSSNVLTEWGEMDDVSLLSVNSSTKSGNSVATADHFVIEKDTEATPSSAVDSSTMPDDPIDPTSGTDTEVEDNEQPVSDKTPSVDSSTMPVDPIDATSSTAIEVEQPISDKTPVSECEEVTVSIPVTWVSTPEYEKDTAGVYVFTPEIEGYTVSADLPEITVTVGEAAPLMMLLATEDSPEKSIADSSLYFREDSGSQQFSTDNSNWTTYTGEFTITGSSTSDSASTNTVVVLSGTHDITLSDCSIGAVTAENTTVPQAQSPFNIQGGTVNLTLEGTNKLYSANYLIAGLHVGHDASLFITADSTGSLDTYCHKKTNDWGHGAGIGGNVSEVNGSITIDGGNINAYSYHGAGIGGGYKAINSSVTINGGNVTAVSGGGCGIGSGNDVYQSGGAVTINGGNINVNGKATTIKNGSGKNVYLATFTEPVGNTNKVFNVITPAYELTGSNAIDGKWYVYLPTGAAIANYDGAAYTATVVSTGLAVFTHPQQSVVSISDVTNGTVAASANATGAITSGTTKVTEGEAVTITPKADNGYQVDTVSVYKTGEEATIVPVTDYTFAMPAYPVTIRVTTKKIPAYPVSGTVSAGTTSAIVSGLIVNLYDSMDTAFVNSKGSATTSTGGVYSIPSIFNGSYVARVAGVSGSYAASTATVTVNGAAVSGTNITLVALTTKSIAVSSHDHKTGYKVGDVLDVSNLKITVTRSDNSTSNKDVTTDMVSGFDSSAVAASKFLTITLDGKITNYTISVSRAAYSGPAAAASTLSSKTDTQVVLNEVAVAGQTVEYGYSTADNASDATWQSSTTFTGLTAGTTYYFFTRVKETVTTEAGGVSTVLSVTTKTAAAEAPTVTPGTLIGTGDSRPTSAGITINTTTGNEYVISTSATAPTTWPISGNDYFKATEAGIHTFNGLTAATKYYIHVRVAETETAMPSASAYAAQYTLPTTIEASVVTINYMEETLSFDNAYEVSTTVGFNTTLLNGGALQPGTTYYVRVKAASGVPASETVSFTTAARPATPDAVTAGNIKKTDTTITITSTVSTQEYSIDGGTTWKAGNGSLTFTGLTANKHYSVVTRIPATDMSFASVSTAALSVTTKTAAAVAPTVTAETLIGTGDSRPTSDSITINTVAGNEYVISASATAPTTWPTSGDDYFKAAETGIHIFTGLTAATKYYIHVRVAETETAMPSASAYAAQYTLPATIEASVVTINYMEETLSFDNTYEVSTTEGFNTTILNGGALQPGTTYYVRVKAASGVPASEAVSFTTAARPATPDAVTAGNIKKTDTTITITSTVSTQEYSIDGGTTWKAGNGSLTFTGLTANKHYSVVTRIPATDMSFASASTAALSVTTKTAAAVAPTVTAETLIGTGDSRPTSDSITINTVAGNEYVISTSATEPTTWPTSGDDYFKAAETGIHIFTGLTAATKYYIHVRVAETETAMPSVATSVAQYTLPATIEASVVTINYMEETLSFDNTYEVSTTDNFNITIPDGGLVQPGTTYYVRVKAASGVPASEAVSFTTAARPAAPDAVTAGNIKKTDTIITIAGTVSTQEYSIDGGATWKAGNGSLTFTALIANQPYSVLTRIPATGTTFESVSAPLSVTTKMASVALNSSGVTYSVRGGTITGLGNTYEYSMDEGSTWLTTPVTSVTFTEGRVLVRIKETNDAMPSLPQTLGTIAAAAASNAPTLESKTYNSVTLTSMKGYEYSRDSGMTWQSSNVFSGLSGGVEYSFMARIEATNIALPGTVSTALSVTTNETPSSGDSGGGSGTSASSAKPTEPVTGATENKATIDNQGNASVTVTDKNITDAIASAKAEAARQGVNAGEITVLINVSTAEENVTNFSVNLPNTTQQQMISNKIAGIELAVDRPDITVGINLAAVMEINRQANQDVKLVVTKTDGSMLNSAAKTIIQSRPVYDFKASYQDGSKHVTNFGSGKVYVSIPYTPVNNEATGCLYMAYVDDNGEVSRVPGSAYDKNSKSLIFTTDHFSVYGVGYTAPTVNFTDIGDHWAKESIDYVAGRGFIGGNGDGTFDPDAAITRGDFITALGRLANVDTNAYTSSSFIDVKDSSSLPYIEWAYSKGIIQGTENSQFAPDSAITRQETAVILQNYAKATGYQLPAIRNAVSFADATSIDSACKEAVKTMQQAGILMGEQNNRFNPTANTTRAKASAMLHRYIKLSIDPSTAQGWTPNDDGQYQYYKAGVMVSGKWLEIDNKWYYFNADGSLAISTIVDGYEIDENGVMKTK